MNVDRSVDGDQAGSGERRSSGNRGTLRNPNVGPRRDTRTRRSGFINRSCRCDVESEADLRTISFSSVYRGGGNRVLTSNERPRGRRVDQFLSATAGVGRTLDPGVSARGRDKCRRSRGLPGFPLVRMPLRPEDYFPSDCRSPHCRDRRAGETAGLCWSTTASERTLGRVGVLWSARFRNERTATNVQLVIPEGWFESNESRSDEFVGWLTVVVENSAKMEPDFTRLTPGVHARRSGIL